MRPTEAQDIVRLGELFDEINAILHRHSYVALEGATLTLRSGSPIKALADPDTTFTPDHQGYESIEVFEGRLTIRWPAHRVAE
jgi:hypothetical protein